MVRTAALDPPYSLVSDLHLGAVRLVAVSRGALRSNPQVSDRPYPSLMTLTNLSHLKATRLKGLMVVSRIGAVRLVAVSRGSTSGPQMERRAWSWGGCDLRLKVRMKVHHRASLVTEVIPDSKRQV